MKPVLGWTVLSREEMRQVESALSNTEQDTRDEIGFLLIHQGFADRFFPGTSVLQTRIRYALFVPWVYQSAASRHGKAGDLETKIRRDFIQLAIRLKQLGGEPYDVIGGDRLGQLTSQPPDHVYWTALRVWGLLLPGVHSRTEAIRRLVRAQQATLKDHDGEPLDEAATEAFAGLPEPPDDWMNPEAPLHFKLPPKEREFLRRKLSMVTRSVDEAASLLARCVTSGDAFLGDAAGLPNHLDHHADASDKLALAVARDAAALSAIGRTVYGALVEFLLAADGGPDSNYFRAQLAPYFEVYGEAAAQCNLDSAEALLPELPPHVRDVLRATRTYVHRGRPEAFAELRDYYQRAEVIRKTSHRARLMNTERSAQRRAEWDPRRHGTSPLHYRWRTVRQMLRDLND